MAAPTRQRLIETAKRRFYRDGFRNVGLDAILADVGISKAAFYKHFECKEDLVLAALEDHHRAMLDTFRDMARDRGGPTPIGQLRSLLDVVEHLVESDDFQGCIFVNVAMEFPLPHDPAHMLARENKQAIEEIVRGIAEQAGAADPPLLSRQLCLLIEGAYVTRHVTGDRQSTDVARSVANLVIGAHCPAAVTAS